MIDVGTSYFRRLMKGNSYMMLLAESCPEYSQYVQTSEEFPQEQISNSFVGVQHAELLTRDAYMTMIFLTCIYLAAKVLEHVPYKNLLTTMMSHVYGCGVPSDLGEELEVQVLEALDWRLGPVYKRSEEGNIA